MTQLRHIKTNRLRIAYHRAGEGKPRKLLLLHGNLSSSVFFLPLLPRLAREYDVVAPDLRCFGDTEDLPVDATRGYRDWSDDVYALCRALGWDRFRLLGWSLGGDVAMQFTADHPECVEKLILVAPGSPYGFGGTQDERGRPYHPVGLGAGGGCANPVFVHLIRMKNRLYLRELLHEYFFEPPFRMSRLWEDRFLNAVGKVKLGLDRYPGDFRTSARWPYVVAGKQGVLNCMAPQYADLSALNELERKPELLWLRGDRDRIVSDASLMEFGTLGAQGHIPGWPGPFLYPPQPMLRQTRYFLRRYAENGGTVSEVVIPGGHLCILESEDRFFEVLHAFEAGTLSPGFAT